MLARAVDAGERLLVEQALHAVLLGDRLEASSSAAAGGRRRRWPRSNIGAISNWPGRDLVVAGLGRDAELEQLALGVHHEAEHPLGDRAEVVVVELLALRRLGAEQRAAGVDQVGPGQEEVPVDQEVLLLGAAERRRRRRGCRGRTASGSARRASPIACWRAQQRRLVVQRLAGHRHEHRRDAQRVAVRVLQDVRRAGDVPAGVAAGLEGAAQAAVTGSWTRPARPGSGSCRRTRPASGRRRPARGSCRASRRSGRSAGRRRARSGWRPSPAPSPSSPRRPTSATAGSSLAPFSMVATTDLKTDLGSRSCISALREDVRAEDLARRLAGVEADGRRHVRLDVVDRLQAHCISAQLEFLSLRIARIRLHGR